MASRLGVDEIPRCLPGKKPDEFDKAGIGFWGGRDARDFLFRGLDDQAGPCRQCSLPLCHVCAILAMRYRPHRVD